MEEAQLRICRDGGKTGNEETSMYTRSWLLFGSFVVLLSLDFHVLDVESEIS